ncbi:MAG TPA: hypothetical protein VK900_08645 [Anaerolineales bacterium]|nr:hypothetical protein [Anaerolineales bacterium]
MMNRITHLTIVLLFASLLAACSGAGSSIPVTGEQSDLQLTIESPDGESAFQQGEAITYNYVLTNTGSQSLSGPVIVDDTPRQVACPQLDTVGNQDDSLDFNESITCTAYYTPSEEDRSAGSITNQARAVVGGAVSNEASLTLGVGQEPSQNTPTPSAQGTGELSLVANASPQSYTQAGETITYSYVITNTGQAPVGPDQFTITDSRLGAPLNCGPADTTLVPGQTVTCAANYTVTAADVTAADITNSATASGGGQTSASASTTVTGPAASAVSPTPFAAATATPGFPADSTETPSVMPTVPSGSSAEQTPGAAAAPGAVNVIDLPAGADSILLPGVAPAGGGIRYSLNATQGQELVLNLVVTTNQINLVVTGPDGAVLEPGAAASPWRQSLAVSGEYLIDVLDTSGTQNQPYLLELRLSPAN